MKCFLPSALFVARTGAYRMLARFQPLICIYSSTEQSPLLSALFVNSPLSLCVSKSSSSAHPCRLPQMDYREPIAWQLVVQERRVWQLSVFTSLRCNPDENGKGCQTSKSLSITLVWHMRGSITVLFSQQYNAASDGHFASIQPHCTPARTIAGLVD